MKSENLTATGIANEISLLLKKLRFGENEVALVEKWKWLQQNCKACMEHHKGCLTVSNNHSYQSNHHSYHTKINIINI